MERNEGGKAMILPSERSALNESAGASAAHSETFNLFNSTQKRTRSSYDNNNDEEESSDNVLLSTLEPPISKVARMQHMPEGPFEAALLSKIQELQMQLDQLTHRTENLMLLQKQLHLLTQQNHALRQQLRIHRVTVSAEADRQREQLGVRADAIRGLLLEAAKHDYIPVTLLGHHPPQEDPNSTQTTLLETRLFKLKTLLSTHPNAVPQCMLDLLGLPATFLGSMSLFLQCDYDGEEERLTWPELERVFLALEASSKARRMFDILACSNLPASLTVLLKADGMRSLILSIVRLHSSLTACCSSHTKTEDFLSFVLASIFFQLSRSRRYAITFAEFECGNLVDILLLMSTEGVDPLTTNVFNQLEFGKLHSQFQTLVGHNRTPRLLCIEKLDSFCNLVVLRQILCRCVFQLWSSKDSRDLGPTDKCVPAGGLEFADWVWLCLAMQGEGGGMGAFDWFRALDPLDGKVLTVADMQEELQWKSTKLLKTDKATIELKCQRKDLSEDEKASKIAQLEKVHAVQERAVRTQLASALDGEKCDMKLIFQLLITMKKTKQWEGYINFSKGINFFNE